MFVGRRQELGVLREELAQVRAGGAGRFVLIKGRRRVGKSRLVEEFLSESGAPYAFFTASRQSSMVELADFADALAGSGVEVARTLSEGNELTSWEGALNRVASVAEAMPQGQGLAVVIDEFPYLAETEGALALEGSFQKLWDRRLQKLPVLLILVGSDLAMMEAIVDHERPLYGRPQRQMTIRPLSPLDVADLVGLSGRDAVEAYCVTGGLPLVAASRRHGESLPAFVRRTVSDPTSPVVVDGEHILAAEFPPDAQARRVLSAIGAGQRTFTAISRLAGLKHTSLARALETLTTKQIVAVESPLSSRPSREPRYRIADSYLRYWLTLIAPSQPEIDRGRGHLVADRVLASWPDYVGRAVEPVLRESMERLLPDPRVGEGLYAGSFWTRTGNAEVDLVLAAKPHSPTTPTMLGSIKWRQNRPFGRRDLEALANVRGLVPGTTSKTPLLAISASGFDPAVGRDLDLALEPTELLQAWREA